MNHVVILNRTSHRFDIHFSHFTFFSPLICYILSIFFTTSSGSAIQLVGLKIQLPHFRLFVLLNA